MFLAENDSSFRLQSFHLHNKLFHHSQGFVTIVTEDRQRVHGHQHVYVKDFHNLVNQRYLVRHFTMKILNNQKHLNQK